MRALRHLKGDIEIEPSHRHKEGSGTKIYINESLCTYYKKLWSKWKELCDVKHILSFLVSNGSIRVKLKNEAVSIITHDCDLANLFPYNPLTDGY